MLQQIPLRLVKADTSTQSRCNIDAELVEEYAEQFKAGAKFPPVEATFDGTNYYVWDGIHRTQGAERAGLESIDANVVDGKHDDAKWMSYSANKSHGKRRTNADKERAVRLALADRPGWSDRAIAEHVGVSHTMVAQHRQLATVASCGNSAAATKRTGKDGKVRDTSKVSDANKKRTKPKQHTIINPDVDSDMEHPAESTREPGEDDVTVLPPEPMTAKDTAAIDKKLWTLFGQLVRTCDDRAEAIGSQGKHHAAALGHLSGFESTAKEWIRSGKP